MVRKSIADQFHISDLSTEEMHPDGYTYTYETLERLHKKYPDQTYYFIIGADSLYDFDTWCRPDRICKAASLLVATRNAVPEESLKEQMLYLEEKYKGNFIQLHTPNLEISSQTLRDWIRQGKSVRYYLVDEVIYLYSRRRNLPGIVPDSSLGNYKR